MKLSSGVITMLASRLESDANFRRSYRECDRCGRSRLLTAFVGVAEGEGTTGSGSA